MKTPRSLARALLAFALAMPLPAQTLMPGSVLVYPCIRSDATAITLVSVTNQDAAPAGPAASNAVVAYFNYVVATPDPGDPFHPARCDRFCLPEYLTPADTVTVGVHCHAPGGATQGYLLVHAVSAISGRAVSHDHLIGSAQVFDFLAGTIYSYNAIPFASPRPHGMPTDVNGNGALDFDGVEYARMHCELYLDSFLGVGGISLALAEFSGLPSADVTLELSVWNDDERALSAHLTMGCWFQAPLPAISGLFTQAFLAGTANDPSELDLNCDGLGDFETGWVAIRATQARLGPQIVVDPPLLGLVIGAPGSCHDNRLLFGSEGRCGGRFR